MPTMDIFNADPFSAFELTGAIEKIPHKPQLLGTLNLFAPRPVRTETVAVEERNGTLALIQTSQRGAPLEEGTGDKRKIRDFRTVRIAKGDTIQASEIQNIRAFGRESELMQVMDEVMRRLAGPTGLISQIELTWENMRLGAIQGIVTDADGSTIIDWYSAMSVTQADEIDFDLDNASPAPGAVRKKCNQVIRQMMVAAAGVWIPGQTSVMALCGDNFWDDLTAHKEVRETYLNTQQAADLREINQPYETFRYGGITWMNYRGTDDGSTVAVHTDKAKFFPVGAPGAFEVAHSPLESIGFVNTPGKPLYSMIVRDLQRDMWVRPEVYSYPLFICTRPAMLQRAKRTLTPMSRVDDIIQAVALPAILREFGDPVTLPNGSVVNGVFERYGSPTSAPWSEVGVGLPLSAQPNPSVELRDADAAPLAINDRLEIGGAGYLVTATPQPNGSGLTRVELMPERTTDAQARWQ
ncbi:MAG: major capsid protein [Chromatiales bacterium]|nr:major capsid protein [Chromatiales bacterium]